MTSNRLVARAVIAMLQHTFITPPGNQQMALKAPVA
jgi:hypothetical protein